MLARLPFQGKGQRGIESRYDVGGCSVRIATAFSDEDTDERASFLIRNVADEFGEAVRRVLRIGWRLLIYQVENLFPQAVMKGFAQTLFRKNLKMLGTVTEVAQ